MTIAYATEGSTDQRFLHHVIRKTFEEVALECAGSIEVYEPVFLKANPKMVLLNKLCSYPDMHLK